VSLLDVRRRSLRYPTHDAKRAEVGLKRQDDGCYVRFFRVGGRWVWEEDIDALMAAEIAVLTLARRAGARGVRFHQLISEACCDRLLLSVGGESDEVLQQYYGLVAEGELSVTKMERSDLDVIKAMEHVSLARRKEVDAAQTAYADYVRGAAGVCK
jgi:hypothetical protein